MTGPEVLDARLRQCAYGLRFDNRSLHFEWIKKITYKIIIMPNKRSSSGYGIVKTVKVV